MERTGYDYLNPNGTGGYYRFEPGLRFGQPLAMGMVPSNPATGEKSALVPYDGFAMTEARDAKKCRILFAGMNYNVFVGKGRGSRGPVHVEHPVGVKNTVGFPVSVEQRTTPDGYIGAWVSGYLYKSRTATQEVLELAQTFEEAGGYQQFGFSVEGTIDKWLQVKDGFDLTETSWNSLAITLLPQNDKTWMNLAHSLYAPTALQASAVGSTPQGVVNVSSPGAEVDPVIPQSIAGRPDPRFVAAFLQEFPSLTWAEGEEYVAAILETLAATNPGFAMRKAG